MIFFLFLHENICCGYSLEAPHRGASNEYPQHIFLWRNKKKFTRYPPLSRPMNYYWPLSYMSSSLAEVSPQPTIYMSKQHRLPGQVCSCALTTLFLWCSSHFNKMVMLAQLAELNFFFSPFFSALFLKMKIHCLILCMLGNFACIFVICGIFFFKLTFSNKFFRDTIRGSKSLDPDQARHFVRSDLDPNCLQMLSADDKSRH